jgi:adenylate cyclase
MNEVLDQKPPTTPFNATPAPEGRGPVLVVDDEEQNRTLLRDFLDAHGYATTEAVNGEQALSRVLDTPPDVILLDVNMPQLDGFEVCRRLKADPTTASIPVLMVTALSERRERLIGIAAGANDFLNKPVDLQDLLLRVRNAMQAKTLFNQLQIERERSERLLLNILPGSIAERMKGGDETIADHHPEVSLLVADLVGFTAMASYIDPGQVVFLLNEIFCEFDRLVAARGLEKIKTIGDTYMVAAGLLAPIPNQVQASAELALEMKEALAIFNEQYNMRLLFRAGISTGPLVSGVIGRNKFAFDLWGEAVDTACQISACAVPGSIQVDEATFERLCEAFPFSSPRAVPLRSGITIKTRALETGAVS